MFDENFYEDEQNRNPENLTERTEKDRNEVLIRGTIIGITGNTRISRLRVLCNVNNYIDVPTITFEGKKRPNVLPGERVTIRAHFHIVELKNQEGVVTSRFTTIVGDEIARTEEFTDPLTGRPFYPQDENFFRIYGEITDNRKMEKLSVLCVSTTDKEECEVRVSCFGGLHVRAQQLEVGHFVKMEGRIQTPEKDREGVRRNFETPVAIRLA